MSRLEPEAPSLASDVEADQGLEREDGWIKGWKLVHVPGLSNKPSLLFQWRSWFYKMGKGLWCCFETRAPIVPLLGVENITFWLCNACEDATNHTVRNTISDLSSLPVNFWSTITIRFPDNNRLTHVFFFLCEHHHFPINPSKASISHGHMSYISVADDVQCNFPI